MIDDIVIFIFVLNKMSKKHFMKILRNKVSSAHIVFIFSKYLLNNYQQTCMELVKKNYWTMLLITVTTVFHQVVVFLLPALCYTCL